MTVKEVIGLLLEKRNRLKTIELDNIAHIHFENDMEIALNKLIQVFQDQETLK
jgi:hypothetical protein